MPCRMDYCNSLQYGINDGLLRRLQSVQNAAAHLVTGACRWCDYIFTIAASTLLHWLPVRQRVTFKVPWLKQQSLSAAAAKFLADDCRLLSDVDRFTLRLIRRYVPC